MFTLYTTIDEINLFFENLDKEENTSKKKDLLTLIKKHRKPGQKSVFPGVDGISYIRALDCFFYMFLTSVNKKTYALDIRGLKSEKQVVVNVELFMMKENQIGDNGEMDWDSINDYRTQYSGGNTLRDIADHINKNEAIPFDECHRIVLCRIIEQLCSPPLDRYLAPCGLSWCREERQIALFLYNILLNKKTHPNTDLVNNSNIKNQIKSIFGCSYSNLRVDQVYYEAAIIRDYFYGLNKEEKIQFEKSLLGFCFNYQDKEFTDAVIDSYCANSCKSLTGAKEDLYKLDMVSNMNDKTDGFVIMKQKLYFACMMMNAKPDIIVLYHDVNHKEDRKAIALECKFESDAGKYKDYNGNQTINQELLQELIMTFLFGENRSDNREKNPVEYYHSNRDERWKRIYNFCNVILNSPLTKGYFYENCESNSRVINMGVKEIDFKNKSNKTQHTILAEELIDCVYCGGK